MSHTLVRSSELQPEEQPRGLEELTAVTAFADQWTRLDAPQIVTALADELGPMIHAEILWVTWDGPEDRRYEAAFLAESALSTSDRIAAARRYFRQREEESGVRYANTSDSEGDSEREIMLPVDGLPNLSGEPPHLVDMTFGRTDRSGRLRAVSSRPGFPTEVDMLILRVACNQAAAILERWNAEQEFLHRETNLRRKEHELRDFVESAPVGLHWIDAEGIILWANRAELDLLGYSAEEYIGHSLAEFHVDEAARDQLLACLRRHEPIESLEARVRCRDGSLRDVAITANVYREDGRFIHSRCFTRDVTQWKQTERRLTAKRAVTRILSEVGSFDEAAPQILRALRECLDADVCDLWLLDELGSTLTLAAVDCDEAEDLQPFLEQSRRTRFGMGEGLPGRVWQTRNAQWVEQAAIEDNFPRAAAAIAAHLQTAAAFPIVTGAEFFGVVEIFTQRRLQRDEPLLAMMATAGAQIGQYLRQSRSRRALREQVSRKAAILESALDCIVTMDHQGRIVDFNPAAEKTFGYRRAEVIGQPLAEMIIPPRLREQHNSGLQRYLRTGVSSIINRRTELSAMRSDGTEFPAELAVVPTRPEDGPPFFAAYLRDLSEWKHAERQRQAIEERFASFMKHLPGAAWIKDALGRYIYANEFAQKIFRTPLEDLQKKTDWEVFPVETARQFREHDEEARQTAHGIQTIEQLQHGDGVVHHSLVNKFPIFNGRDEPEYVGGIAFDVTDWQLAEAALRDSEAKLQAILDNTPACVFVKDLQGRYTLVNESMLELFGWSSAEVALGKTDFDLFRHDAAEVYTRNDQQVMQSGLPCQFEEVAPEAAGRVYLVLKFPIRDHTGAAYGLCGVATDISERKRAEEALRKGEERLRFTLEAAGAGSWDWDITTGRVEWS
ncbi:MAG: PAS domain S-box protein, partial [Planctomycetaceae bacterium]|nr:PAS domain S-box protein [Planctomycetaceae bacterium]